MIGEVGTFIYFIEKLILCFVNIRSMYVIVVNTIFVEIEFLSRQNQIKNWEREGKKAE